MSLKPYPRKIISIGVLCLVLIFKLTGPTNSSEAATTDKEPNKQINGAKPTQPDDIQSNRNCVLCGFIRDSKTGKPVTDATVNIKYRYEAKTNANGLYCIDKIPKDGNYRISIDSNEYVGIYNYQEKPIVNLSKDKQVVKDFRLDKACKIKISVVNEANEPIEGAELSISLSGDNRFRHIVNQSRRRRTDNDGIHLLGGIPPSPTSYLITATSSTSISHRRKDGLGFVQRQWNYAPGKLTVILNDTEAIESGRIILQKGVDVNGCAKYKDGIPASDLSINAYPDWWSSNSCPEDVPVDANGLFTLRHIVPGIYRLMANIPKGDSGSIGIPVLTTRLPLPDNELLMLTIPEKSPQSLVSISGKLTFAGDKIPRYVDIQAYSPNYGHHSAMWQNYRGDACDTNFVIDRLEPGKYKLTFRGQNVEEKIIEDVEAPSEDLEVEIFTAEQPIIKGTVINSQTSQPIQHFRARARKTRTLRGAYYVQSDQWLEFDDTDGRFSIEAVGPGIYQVQIAAEGFAWTWSEDINSDCNNPVVIKLSAGGCIKGRVVNEAGQLINGAKVIPLSEAAGEKVGLRTCRKDPFISEDSAVETVDGVFELKNLAPGNESIKVVCPDYAYSIINDIEVKEGQTTEDIRVVLEKGGTVEGYVFDAQGQPQPNVTLFFQNDSGYRGITEEKAGRLAMVTTDAGGYYRVGGLPDELCYVKRHTGLRGINFGVICRTIVPANGKISRLDFGGKPNVKGQIIIDGVPIANRRIILSAIDGQHSSTFRYYAMTEPDGRFTFGGIPKGRWKIFYEDTEQRNNWIIIAEFDLTDSYIDLGLIPSGISTVRVSIEYMEGTPEWDITRAYLQEGDKPWGQRIAQLDKSPDENGSYVAKYILPGEHYLVLIRKDYATLRQPIEVTDNDVNITVRMPKCASGIYGSLTGKALYGLTVWRKDKTVVGHIKPDEKGDYKLDNLPAGEYLAGGNMLIDKGALLEFELEEGEQKKLDIDVPDIPKIEMGSLQVMVVDENGVPLTGVNAWLQGSAGTIEPIMNSGQEVYFVAEPGKYTLHASCIGYKEVKQPVSVETFDLKKKMRQPSPVLLRLDKVAPGQEVRRGIEF
jgi:hypothetical protein